MAAEEPTQNVRSADAIKAALDESERRYRDLVEHSLGLICTHDLQGNLISINPAAAQSLGYEPEFGVGRNLVEFLAQQTRHLFRDYLDRIKSRGEDSGLMRVVARDGRERIWMYRNIVRQEPSTRPYVLGHAIDITERVAAEQTLRAQQHALRRAHAELDRRVAERTATLAEVNERLRVEISERQRAERSRERVLMEQRDTLEFLESLSERLAPVLTVDQLLDALAALPLPPRVDWTMLHVLGEEGILQSRPGAHLDPTRKPLLEAFAAAASAPVVDGSIVSQVLMSRRLMIAAGDGHQVAAEFLGNADIVPLLQVLGMRSVAVVPIVIEDRTTIAFSLVAGANGPFTHSDGIVFGEVERRIRLVLDRVELYRQAQEASRLKDEFLSTLSHELRTPLNAIFGWTRILRTRQLDERTAHGLAVIERNTEAQIKLIEEVLDVSRIVTGKMTLNIEPVDIRTTLRATIDAAKPAIDAKGIQLKEVFLSEVPPVFADPYRLQQVFWNLLSNALKFTPADGAITVTIKSVSQHVEIEFSDTGVGIRREVLPFVFDRFRQAESSTTRHHGGLGLGLAIVRHIAELHGGSVTAASPGEGCGATFTLHLPADRRFKGAVATGSDTAAAVAPSGLPLAGRTILIVEDHDDARDLLGTVLKSAGAQVALAGSSAEAVASFVKQRPDALVADIGLPGEDGYAMLNRIRALDQGSDHELPAIALTAYARASDRERALAAGYRYHVVKPVDPQELVSLLQSALGCGAASA